MVHKTGSDCSGGDNNNMNRRGVMGIILFFLILFTVLIAGFIGAMAIGIIDFASDQITPIMTEIGVVGPANVSEAAEYTFGVTNTFVQAMPWIFGFLYVAALVFSILFITVYGENPHPAYIGFYVMMIVLLIFGSIIMSNMYEEIYTANDEIADRLHDQLLISYMILYSPFILSLIALITGIYLFARPPEGAGGFGI